MANTIIVDSREATLKEAGDVILSNAAIYAEAGEIFAGIKSIPANRTTIFKSVGIAIEDIVSAHLVLSKLNSQTTNLKMSASGWSKAALTAPRTGFCSAPESRPQVDIAECRRCATRRHHSITSSARPSSIAGISSPSAFAVLRLMTRANLVGW